MTKISIFLFLIYLCMIMVGHTHAQKIAIKLVDSLTDAPVASASILLFEDNNGTVTNENGIAYIGENKSSDANISHLNYDDKRIRLAELGTGVNTVLMCPKSPIALSEVVITNNADKSVLGRWMLKEVAASKVNHKGKYERRHYKNVPANVKEYGADGSFRVSLRDKEVMNGQYTAVRNQLHEQVVGADIKELAGLDNKLFYVVSKDYKTLIVKYQLPKSAYVVEEVWKKIPTTDNQ
ncbi:hypothetical protein PQ465_13840 [Sphingobacterium oryzagri]|uniref:Carboxypeptidase regulatory-like domain-containing protein n=1 Tax=Sphingobacterium oryzagri TaxID=3025669 RepID=A0ABY7WD39_9SPHI|nr:hypothetical protein [Sphingobacterium sp. KACC 22765]WDF67385.1 hypothetical protein PQ465_13840 [Sphingobacterium sp. KACC 22765]